MSVARIREIVARMRALGFVVHEEPGCWTRGNGQSPDYRGIVNHHTATKLANANLGILIHGRPDLDGPLCNFTTWANGDVGLIAVFPANHAGASGGYDTAPLPVTGLFNKLVIGNEIAYTGEEPMTRPQYHTSTTLSKVVVDVCADGDIRCIKAHAGTSVTGKWDPGYARGKTIDMNQFRRDAAGSGQALGDDDVAYKDWPMDDRNTLVANVCDEMMKRLQPLFDGIVPPKDGKPWRSAVWNAANSANAGIQGVNTKLDQITAKLEK